MLSNLEYGRLLDFHGARILEISAELRKNLAIEKCVNPDLLKRHGDVIQQALIKYAEVRNMISMAKPPLVVEEEHEALIDSFDDFLDGTKICLHSISLDPLVVDTEKYHQGLAKQTVGEMGTKNTVDRIIEKFSI